MFKDLKPIRHLVDFYRRMALLKKVRSKQLFFPKTIYIEPTNMCNAKCIMCPNKDMKRKKGVMSERLFKKIVDECKTFEKNGLSIHLHKDGEPLLDESLFDRIKYLKRKLRRSKVNINSNAALLNEKKAKELLKAGIDSITFSVDGVSRETYEEIRTGLNYNNIKTNLDRFFSLKQIIPNTTKVTMQMVVCTTNKHEVLRFRQLWSKKADKIFFKSMHNFLDKETSIKTKAIERKQLRFCLHPFNSVNIYWDGSLGLCCWDYDNLANIGSVKEDSLVNVYNNEKLMLIRSSMCKMNCKKINPCNRCSQIYGYDMDMIWI